MLAEFQDDDELCAALAQLLTGYFQNPQDRDDLGEWDRISVPLIPKRQNACEPEHFRGISRIPVMKKMTLKYMPCRLNEIDTAFPTNPRTFGFKAGSQTHDVIWILNSTLALQRHRGRPLYLV